MLSIDFCKSAVVVVVVVVTTIAADVAASYCHYN